MHSVSPEAEVDLDGIWSYVARASGSLEVADRLVDAITARFYLLAENPYIGRRRDQELRPSIRSFPVGEYIVFYRVGVDSVSILRVLRGSRDITALFTTP